MTTYMNDINDINNTDLIDAITNTKVKLFHQGQVWGASALCQTSC